ncbi:hypothetical protein TNCV_4845701 [Trichonephila clavipes]|uniref:Uncharacterized protein n=1 Tax=Trichonephila clavipes TaxID=2585209 RepID=A0A8X7BM54_TRICX|nr:hypothetical protein TNCV_4845701 [Trichonephila clavipes]
MFKVLIVHIEAGLSASWNGCEHRSQQRGVHRNTIRMQTFNLVRLCVTVSLYTNSLRLPHRGNNPTVGDLAIVEGIELDPNIHFSGGVCQIPPITYRSLDMHIIHSSSCAVFFS